MDSAFQHRETLRRTAWFVVPAIIPLVVSFALSIGEGVRAVGSIDSGDVAVLVDSDGLPLSDPNRENDLWGSWLRADSLETEAAFLSGKIDLAASKEASLWIDLSDSTATLAIEGVPVRVCRISGFELSAMLVRLRASSSASDSLRVPFTLVSSMANIPHIPIRVVEAPKDTAEARLRPPDAFAPEERNVTAELRFDRRLVVHLISDDEGLGGPWAAGWKAIRSRTGDAVDGVARMFSNRNEPLAAEISIRMSSNDVRAVYRGLRQGAGMVVRLADS